MSERVSIVDIVNVHTNNRSVAINICKALERYHNKLMHDLCDGVEECVYRDNYPRLMRKCNLCAMQAPSIFDAGIEQ